jgi:TonB-dependent starch-binding outer membrane protein SusC
MKKNELVDEWDFSYLTKTFRIMRITLFLMLALILQTFANEAYSQKTKLSLDYNNTRLEIVLDEIEELSEFFFLANEKLVDLDRSVNLSVKNKKIDEILDMLFAGTDVVYTITDRKIILAPSFLAEDAQQQRSVSGKVTDSGGQPLPGVTVVVKGTTQGTVTNADGNILLPIFLKMPPWCFRLWGCGHRKWR